MIELNSVLNCVRGMDYRGTTINYVTGVCGEVKLSTDDCIEVLRRFGNGKIGYVSDAYDLFKLLCDSGAISKSIYLTFQEHKIVYELENNYINIDSMKKLCEHYKINDLMRFLIKAKKEINEFGSYIDYSFKSMDKNKCNDRNLSNTLNLSAISNYAELNNMSSEDVYVEVCDIIAELVFGTTMEDIRSRYGLYFEDYLSDSITQYEFDKITFLCSTISYLLKYSHLSIKGLDILSDMALRSFVSIYEPKEYNTKPNRRNTNNNNDVDPYLAPIRDKKAEQDLEDFKRYM